MLRRALVCSKDPQLLMTRSLLLERAGFNVTRASSVAEINEIAGGGPFDLTVLGHTLEASEIQKNVQIICERWPQSRILVLNVNGEPTVDVPNCEHLRSSDGPEALLAKANEMVPR
jgi:DNA-binding response OmpR family regulator